MIDDHFNNLEKAVKADPFVIIAEFNRVRTSSVTAYIKGVVKLIDGSSLSIFQHVRIKEKELLITDYRYHYMNHGNRLIFRYDNAPHHPELDTFPHHKHTLLGKEPSPKMPKIEEVLDEISNCIIKGIISG